MRYSCCGRKTSFANLETNNNLTQSKHLHGRKPCLLFWRKIGQEKPHLYCQSENMSYFTKKRQKRSIGIPEGEKEKNEI